MSRDAQLFLQLQHVPHTEEPVPVLQTDLHAKCLLSVRLSEDNKMLEKISKNSTYEIKKTPYWSHFDVCGQTDITKLIVAFRSPLRKSLSKSLNKQRVLLIPYREHWASVRTSSLNCSVKWHKCTELKNTVSAGGPHTDHLWFALLSILCNKQYLQLVDCDPEDSLAPKIKAVGSFSNPATQHYNT